MDAFYILIAFLAGCGLPLQAAANARLSRAVSNPFAAATLQLFIAVALLLLAAAATAQLSAFQHAGHAAWWQLSAGLASAAYVVAGIMLFPRLGAVVTIGLFVAGQTCASLVLDGFGLLGLSVRPYAAQAWLGVAAVALGIVLIVDAQGGPAMRTRGRAGWMVLAVGCGGLLPVQGAINVSLVNVLGAPLAVAAASFVVATLGMGAVSLAVRRIGWSGRPVWTGLTSMPSWGWAGGLVGACYVTSVFTAMAHIGAATTIGLTIAGQQLVSIIIDRHGLFGLPVGAISRTRLVGTLVLLGGVLLIKLG